MSVEDKLKHFRKMEYLSDSTSDSIHEASVKTHEFFTFIRHYLKNGVLEGGDATTSGRRVEFAVPIRGLINGQFVLYDSTTSIDPGVVDGTRWMYIYPKPGSVYRNEIRVSENRPDDSTGLVLWSIDVDDRGNVDEVRDERIVIPAVGFRERRWIGWYPTLDDLPRWGFQDGDVASVGSNIYIYEESDAEAYSGTTSLWHPWTSRKGVKRAFKYWRINNDDVEIIADSTADTITFIEGDNIIFAVDVAADDATMKVFINTDLNLDKYDITNVILSDISGVLSVSGTLWGRAGWKMPLFSDFRRTLAERIVFTPSADVRAIDGTGNISKMTMREGWIDGTFLEILLNTDLTGSLTINNQFFQRRDLILNGSFEGNNPPENWSIWSGTTADATAYQVTTRYRPDTGVYGREAPDETHWSYIRITAAGSETNDVQYFQSALPISTGRRYVAAFYARAQSSRNIGVYLIYNKAPYYNLGLSQTVTIDSTFTEYMFSFKSTEDSTTGRLSFYLGSDGNDVEIDKVRLYYYENITISGHADRHEDGGGDEVSMTNLKGRLKDPQKMAYIHGWPVSTTSKPKDGQVLRFVGCTCYDACYGDTPCTCDSACNVDLCDQCDAACYGYVACTCNSTCNVDPCGSCDLACYGYVACSCVATCYIDDGKGACGCNSTCYGFSGCTCNVSCVIDACNQCDAACHGYVACTCNSTCNSDSCDQCDAACFGYSACSCNLTTFGATNQWTPVTP